MLKDGNTLPGTDRGIYCPVNAVCHSVRARYGKHRISILVKIFLNY